MAKPKVFYGVDKRKNDKSEENEQLSDYESSPKSIESYTFIFNDQRKLYDLLIVTIDTRTLESSVEVENLKVDSEARAIMEVQKRNSDNYIKRLKRK